jgi:phosphoglycerate kinase
LLLDFSERIRLPVDVAANIADNRVDLPLEQLPVSAPIFDLGIQSIRNLSMAIKAAGTVHLNGPAGVFELPDFALGTIEMLNACAESGAYVVVGGGHTATLIMKRNLASKMGHVSTGGGACLDYISGRSLPAVASLEASAKAFSMKPESSINNQ